MAAAATTAATTVMMMMMMSFFFFFLFAVWFICLAFRAVLAATHTHGHTLIGILLFQCVFFSSNFQYRLLSALFFVVVVETIETSNLCIFHTHSTTIVRTFKKNQRAVVVVLRFSSYRFYSSIGCVYICALCIFFSLFAFVRFVWLIFLSVALSLLQLFTVLYCVNSYHT